MIRYPVIGSIFRMLIHEQLEKISLRRFYTALKLVQKLLEAEHTTMPLLLYQFRVNEEKIKFAIKKRPGD